MCSVGGQKSAQLVTKLHIAATWHDRSTVSPSLVHTLESAGNTAWQLRAEVGTVCNNSLYSELVHSFFFSMSYRCFKE